AAAVCWLDVGETKPAEEARRSGGASGIGGVVALLREPRFLAHASCAAFSVGAFYVFLAGAALVATATFGLTAAMLGVVIGSITVGFLAGSAAAARLAGAFEPGAVMTAGRVIACCGLALGLAAWTLGLAHPVAYFAATLSVGVGNGLTMPAASAGAMAVRPELAATAAGVNGALAVLVGAALTTLAGMLLTEENAAPTLLSLMLAASAVALCAANWARRGAKASSDRGAPR
ncbi:MAG: Bcr/CflA family drug resistance efflux transporter, partial [Pseudomonadota bacterium]